MRLTLIVIVEPVARQADIDALLKVLGPFMNERGGEVTICARAERGATVHSFAGPEQRDLLEVK